MAAIHRHRCAVARSGRARDDGVQKLPRVDVKDKRRTPVVTGAGQRIVSTRRTYYEVLARDRHCFTEACTNVGKARWRIDRLPLLPCFYVPEEDCTRFHTRGVVQLPRCPQGYDFCPHGE